jgi:cbb3-type cytochrome oxidase maturation protein
VDVIFLLLACSLSVAALFLGAFIWAVRAGQYDDTTSPAWRALFDSTSRAATPPGDDTRPTPTR